MAQHKKENLVYLLSRHGESFVEIMEEKPEDLELDLEHDTFAFKGRVQVIGETTTYPRYGSTTILVGVYDRMDIVHLRCMAAVVGEEARRPYHPI